jgi:sulfoquinovosidase
MRHWVTLLCFAGCGSKEVPLPELFSVGDFEVRWSEGAFSIMTDAGVAVFNAPADGPLLTLRRSEVEVEYGSGSFVFDENSRSWCDASSLNPTKWGDDEVTFDVGFSGCKGAATMTVRSAGDHRVQLVIESSGDWNQVSLFGATSAEEHFVGFGAQYDGVNMKGRVVPIWCQEQGHGRGLEPLTSVLSAGVGNPAGEWHNSYTCVPWTLTSQGRGVAVENTERVIFDLEDDDVFGVTAWQDTLDLQLIAGDGPAQLVERYTEISGRMSALPEWTQQGAILRAHGGAEDVRATVASARANGVPLAAVWIEDWCGLRDTVLGSRMWWNWDVDRSRYPDWEALVSELDAEGVAVLAYINPYLTDASEKPDIDRHLFAEARDAGFLVRDDTGEIFWMDQGGFEAALVDLTNPDAAAWLQGVIEELIGTGVRGWMADFSEGLPLNVELHDGQAETEHNRWPEYWAQINEGALASTGTLADSLVFHRSGNQRSPGHARAFWLGDQLVTWDGYDGLATVVPGLLSSGLSGYTIQHADTGGYLSVNALGIVRDGELFRRWVELNAFTPLLRMHSTNQPEDNHQWDTDPETIEHLAQMAGTFASLAEVRTQLMEEAATRGWPLVRPLFFHHPDDETAWTIEDQFMLGPDLIMAPVVEPGQEERSAYLPEGSWVHGPTGDAYSGPGWVTVAAPVGQPAVFVRTGSPAASVSL